jgi:hypothetical protein
MYCSTPILQNNRPENLIKNVDCYSLGQNIPIFYENRSFTAAFEGPHPWTTYEYIANSSQPNSCLCMALYYNILPSAPRHFQSYVPSKILAQILKYFKTEKLYKQSLCWDFDALNIVAYPILYVQHWTLNSDAVCQMPRLLQCQMVG